MRALPVVVALAFLLTLLPSVSAEFGPESEDGWPIGINGDVQRPPVDPLDVLHLADDPHRHDLEVAPPLNKLGPFTLFPYYPLLSAEVQRLALDHPDLVRLTSAGKSHANLDLWLLEIADFGNPDMVPLDEREVLYVDGGTHSNEYSGVYFVLEFAQFLLDEYATNETAKWIVENRHTWILPMVNPDGSNVFGRLNAMLVNVNRNFPGTYGTVDESFPMNNPGPEPASEPETQTVIGVLDRIQPDYVNSIHCCGNLWLHPYGAEQLGDTPDIEMFTRICDEAFAEVRDDCGPIWSTIYPASGTTADEGYMRVGASSWSYEMSGRGAIMPWGQPTIMEDPRTQEYESWDGLLHAFMNVHLYGARPEVRSVGGDAEGLDVRLENVGYGPVTNGTIAIGDAVVTLPYLAPNQTVVVHVPGSFSAGTTMLTLDYAKRIYLEPVENRALALTLTESAGRLFGDVGEAPGAPSNVATTEDAPLAWVPLVIAATLLAAVALRRRS